jgi:hypothetical protein
METAGSFAQRVLHVGFAVIPRMLSAAEIPRLVGTTDRLFGEAADSTRGTYAVRNLLQRSTEIRDFASSEEIRGLVEPILGEQALPTRALLFDKTPQANWKVAWHQDLSITVRAKIEQPGFSGWSRKAGLLHVQPPQEILEQMLTVRVHLDDCPASNGALRVIPGSHSNGRLTGREIQAHTRGSCAVHCNVGPGGAVLMRPLLLHSSSASVSPAHRRVIHIEFAACQLPGGLEWMS